MAPKPLPKGQHLVPRLHLQHFAGDDPKGQVWTYDKNAGRCRSARPDETATFTHFYSVELEDGTYDVTVEEQMAANETATAPIYQEMLSGNLPRDNDERSIFSMFLAYLFCRTRAQRQNAANALGRGAQIFAYAHAVDEAAFDEVTRKVEAQRGAKMPQDARAQVRKLLINPSHTTMHVHKAATLVALGPAPQLAGIFSQMRWSLIDARDAFFITSDNPLVKWVEPKTRHPVYGDHGFLNKTAHVSLALSPTRMLILSYDKQLPQHGGIDRSSVDMWNTLRAIDAEQFLYAHAKRSEILELATRFKGSRPYLTTQGFGPDEFAEVVVPRRWKKDR